MEFTRRDLSVMLSALFAAQASAAEKSMNVLPSGIFPFDQLQVKREPEWKQSLAGVYGTTHDGFPIDMHITELAPGNMPHPPHHHVHEEMVMMIEGELLVTILDKSEKIGRAAWHSSIRTRSMDGRTWEQGRHDITCWRWDIKRFDVTGRSGVATPRSGLRLPGVARRFELFKSDRYTGCFGVGANLEGEAGWPFEIYGAFDSFELFEQASLNVTGFRNEDPFAVVRKTINSRLFRGIFQNG